MQYLKADIYAIKTKAIAYIAVSISTFELNVIDKQIILYYIETFHGYTYVCKRWSFYLKTLRIRFLFLYNFLKPIRLLYTARKKYV